MNKGKMIKVDIETHKRLKEKATLSNMSFKEYMKALSNIATIFEHLPKK